MFNYPGEYVQLPWGVCSTTLGSMFKYPGEYVQLHLVVLSPTLGVCSTTLGSIVNYPGEYFLAQLPWGAIQGKSFNESSEKRSIFSGGRRFSKNGPAGGSTPASTLLENCKINRKNLL